MKMNPNELIRIVEDLKYLNRLGHPAFVELLFPNSPDENYNMGKWVLFRDNPLAFLWSCDADRLQLIVDYINGEKYGDSKPRRRPYLHDGGDGQ